MTPFLADAIFWVAVVCCVVAQIAILRATVPPATTAAAPLAQPVRRVQEIVWAVVPALALAGVLVLTWRALHPGVLVEGLR